MMFEKMAEENSRLQDKRVCYACGSDKTYIDWKTNKPHIQWFNNPPIGWLCKRCNNNYITNPKWHPRQLKFKDRRINLLYNPRIGVCNWCRAVVPFDCKRTQIHHESYHQEDPLKDAIELCSRCHAFETERRKSRAEKY